MLTKLFEAVVLAAAVGLLIFTVVYVSPKAVSAEHKSPTIAEMNFDEEDCVGVQMVLIEAYNAASVKMPLTDLAQHVRDFHLGPDATPANAEFIMHGAYGVYAEYPGTETGRRIIMECFANAEKQAAPKQEVEK